MERGLVRQVLTICLEMQSLVGCFSTMCIIPVGLTKREMRSYSSETGVGMIISRGHLVDSRMSSSLRAAGSPEQRTKPGLAPDLFSMKERAAKRGLKTHMLGSSGQQRARHSCRHKGQQCGTSRAVGQQPQP